MVATNSQYGPIARNNLACSFQGIEFGTFDIHLDERRVFVGHRVVEANARNFGGSRIGRSAASASAVSGKANETTAGSNHSIVQMHTVAQAFHECLKSPHNCWISLESDHLAQAVVGRGNECLDCVSGVGSAIDKTF